MAHRLDHYGVGELIPMRDHTPQSIAAMVQPLMDKKPAKIEVDTGVEVAEIIRNICS